MVHRQINCLCTTYFNYCLEKRWLLCIIRPYKQDRRNIEMTKKLYYDNTYIKEFDATVLECIPDGEDYRIVLDQTAFYPEGGGQPYDVGTLQDLPVHKVLEKNDTIYHYMKNPVEVGTTVHGQIDWINRFHNMQNHTGEHILSGLINQTYGYDNVGFHMGSDSITLDMNGMLTEEQLSELELRANDIVFANVPVQTLYPTSEELKELEYRSKKELEGQVRIITVPNADTCACCGTHVKNTGEIGLIKVLGFMKHRGGIRIEMLCGYRALADYTMKQKNLVRIGATLSAKLDQTAEAVVRLKEEKQELEFQMGQLQQKMLAQKAAQYEDGAKVIVEETDCDMTSLRQYANLLKEKAAIVAVFSIKDKNSDIPQYNYVLASKEQDLRSICKLLNQQFEGKGGGTKEMVQGSITGGLEQVKDFVMGMVSEI